jgi:hypothetical protein
MEVVGNKVIIDDAVIAAAVGGSLDDSAYIGRLVGAIRDIVTLNRANVTDMFDQHFDEICERVKMGLRDKESIDDIRSKMSDLKYKIDGFTRDDGVYLQLSEINRTLGALNTKSSATRGKEAEQSVFDLLSDELLTRDGYTIENVSGLAHNCDICVKRTGYSDVRIDVKNYTDKVGQRDVDKFRSDLNTLQNSGIMLCMKNGVVGKKNLEVEQLVCGKFAVFLTNNNYDMSIVNEVIRLLYFLESSTQSEDKGVVKLSQEMLSRLHTTITDGKQRVNSIRTHMKAMMADVDALKFVELENILRSSPTQQMVVVETQSHDQFGCSKCNRPIKSRAALVAHEKSCKQGTTKTTLEYV